MVLNGMDPIRSALAATALIFLSTTGEACPLPKGADLRLNLGGKQIDFPKPEIGKSIEKDGHTYTLLAGGKVSITGPDGKRKVYEMFSTTREMKPVECKDVNLVESKD